jgi:hypothetical protein
VAKFAGILAGNGVGKPMGFNRLMVRTRLYLGFGALVVLSLALGLFGVHQLANVGTEAGKMNALAGNIVRVLDTTRLLQTMQWAQTLYRYGFDETALQEYKDAETTALVLLTDAGSAALSEERRRTYAAVQGRCAPMTRSYNNLFNSPRTRLTRAPNCSLAATS